MIQDIFVVRVYPSRRTHFGEKLLHFDPGLLYIKFKIQLNEMGSSETKLNGLKFRRNEKRRVFNVNANANVEKCENEEKEKCKMTKNNKHEQQRKK